MDGGLGNPERHGGFVVSQPTEKEQFDDLAFSGIMRFEALQRLVQIRQTKRHGWADQQGFVERDMLCAAASFLAFPCLGIVHQKLRITRAATA